MEAGKESPGGASEVVGALLSWLLIIALETLLGFIAPSTFQSDLVHALTVGVSVPVGMYAGKALGDRLAAKKEPASKEEER